MESRAPSPVSWGAALLALAVLTPQARQCRQGVARKDLGKLRCGSTRATATCPLSIMRQRNSPVPGRNGGSRSGMRTAAPQPVCWATEHQCWWRELGYGSHGRPRAAPGKAHLLGEVLDDAVLRHLRANGKAALELLLDTAQHLLVLLAGEALHPCGHEKGDGCVGTRCRDLSWPTVGGLKRWSPLSQGRADGARPRRQS